MTHFADLHIHTYYSDSTYSPQDIVEKACAAGLACVAVTDHDTLDGVRPTMDLAEGLGLEVISGIELSTTEETRDVHVLGYGIALDYAPLLDALKAFQSVRVARIHVMIEKLRVLGIKDICFEEVAALTKADVVGRLHLAQLLVEKGWVKNLREAFEQYLGQDAPAYVEKSKLTVREAIRLIHLAGGAAVLAHPMVTGVDNLISRFVKSGLDGLEVYYPYTSATITRYYERMADKHHLLKTGGSDAHGGHKANTHIGKAGISRERLEELKVLIQARRKS